MHKVCRFMAKMHTEEGAKDKIVMRLVISPMVPMFRRLEDERVLHNLWQKYTTVKAAMRAVAAAATTMRRAID